MSNIVFCNFPLDIEGERIEEIKREQTELIDAIEEYSVKLGQEQDIETFSRFDNVIATEDGYYAAFYASDVKEDEEDDSFQVIGESEGYAAWFREKLGTPKSAKVDILNIVRNLSEKGLIEWETKSDQSFFGCVEFFATYKGMSIQIRRGYPVDLEDKYWITICDEKYHDIMMEGKNMPSSEEFVVIEPMRGVDKMAEMIIKSKFNNLKPTTDFDALDSVADRLEE